MAAIGYVVPCVKRKSVGWRGSLDGAQVWVSLVFIKQIIATMATQLPNGKQENLFHSLLFQEYKLGISVRII